MSEDTDRTKPPPGIYVFDCAPTDENGATYPTMYEWELDPETKRLHRTDVEAIAGAWTWVDAITVEATRRARVEELEWVLELLTSPAPTSGYERSLACGRTLAGVRARLKELSDG